MSQQGYGGFWIRFLALMVDSVIVGTGVVVIMLLILKFLGTEALIFAWFGLSFGPILYWVIMHASERQATYGKALLGLMVTTADGNRISFFRSLARELGKLLSSLPMMLGYVAAAFTKQKQALHDVVASTTVIRHDSGRVGLGLLIGLFGWVAPVAILIFAGGSLASQMQSMNAALMQRAMAQMSADSSAVIPSVSEGSARGDSSAADSSTVVQAASNTPPAAAATTAAAPVTRDTVTPPPPTRQPAAPQPAASQPAAAQSRQAGVVADAPVEAPRRPRPRPETPRVAAPVALDPAAAAALDQLSGRFATEVALLPASFGDRQVQLYDFGAVPRGVAAARVFWPIHGFDARGNPVAIRGQRPVFTTIPRLGAYSGLWQLVYVVTADMAQPNALRDAAAVDAAVRAKRATLREAGLVLNLPIVARGTTLARDTTRGMLGWYNGHDVQFFDFGASTPETSPALGFAALRDSAGRHVVQVADSTTEPRDLQIVDGAPVPRPPSPLRAFADMRSPLPPRPTRSP
jgi:uncharacterized RDD family membrane protein YckC